MRVPSSLALLLGLTLIAGACANPAASPAPPSADPPAASQATPSDPPDASAEAPATDPPGSAAPASDPPASDPPESEPPADGYKVGYISLGESIPFVSIVTDGIREEAEKAGVELVVCDSELDAAKALACAQNLQVQEVQAVLNFQLYEDSSPEVCAAYGDLPTIAIDIIQEPCQVAFMGADNTFAGTIAGRAVGEALEAENDCTYEAVVTLDTKGAGATTLAGWTA